MDTSDQQLVARYLKGDGVAFDLLVARYLKSVYSVALFFVRQAQDAEDLTQDAFVRAMTQLTSFDQSKPFKPWILKIVKNIALDWLKRKKPTLFATVGDEGEDNVWQNVPDPTPWPDALASEEETEREIARALACLDPAERRIVVARHDDGHTFQNIADKTNENVDTVKSRYRRALLKLRKLLAI